MFRTIGLMIVLWGLLGCSFHHRGDEPEDSVGDGGVDLPSDGGSPPAFSLDASVDTTNDGGLGEEGANDDLTQEQREAIDELATRGQELIGEVVTVVFQGIETQGVVTEIGVFVFGDLLASWRNMVLYEDTYLPVLQGEPKAVVVLSSNREWPFGLVYYDLGDLAGTVVESNILWNGEVGRGGWGELHSKDNAIELHTVCIASRIESWEKVFL